MRLGIRKPAIVSPTGSYTTLMKPALDRNPVFYQRIEAAFLFIASIYLYFHLDNELVWLLVLFLTIDLFMLGYLVNPRVGAHVYNLGHSLAIPLVLLVLGVYLAHPLLVAAGLIWAAHIGWDRALGYGLKLESGFTHTHLGGIGKDKHTY